MIKYIFTLAIAVVLLFSCGRNVIPHTDSLSEKSEPNEFFSFQRSYPDFDFDWKGWRNTLQQTRTWETAQSRGLGCGTNLSNWTQQGPMNVGARCNTLASKPDDENTVLAGFASGGIFKSTDGAVNWHPVFDDNMDLAIGDITFSSSNPNIVYAGTGDPNMPSILFNGNGIYKSTDAGETWQHLANSPDGVVSQIVVHPSDPSILWVATMGNPYVRDNQRGIYKSTDGGNSWQLVLFVSDQAGASDLVQSPANPEILYASFWDRIRNNHESIVYGPHASVYKSADGGNTWTQLGGGLPTGVMGRTGLAVSRSNANKVYAVFIDSLSTPGGLYKSIDGGNTWTALNLVQLEDACADFGWYFGKITIDPNNDEELYFHAILLWRKPVGNNSWLNAAGGHADSHDLIFTASGRRYWSNDGGVYSNNPGQMSWTKAKNLPVTQFYRSTFNPHEPDKYWAGAQDNGIQKGNGVNPNSWGLVFSADGFSCAFDPSNPQHFWVEIQNGTVHETMDGGNSWQFGSAGLGSSDRTNWDTPFFMSPNIPNRLYAATYRVYGKDSGGGWGPTSGDLTDGNIFGAKFHTVSCLDESTITVGKLAAGTSDGNVWWRTPAGAWANITTGLPDRYVTSLHFSPTISNRLFVTHSGFRDNEEIPHIHRSDDQGSTWQNISSDLPQVPVNDLLVLPGYSDQVLFAATDAGVYFTTTGGASWKRLGGNMPYVPVFDLERNPARNELVAATFGRGIWTFPFDSVFVQQNPVSVALQGSVLDEMGDGVTAVHLNGTLSADDGTFSLQNIPGCNDYTLTPSRNDNPLNGLTTYDLVLISKHILAIEPLLTPYKIIAADANHSGSITTFDIVQLRKLILGIDSTFANNTSWRFVPNNFTFPAPNNPFQTAFPETLAVQVLTSPLANLDFTAIKVGDVNNTAAPHLQTSSEERTKGIWSVDLDWKGQRQGANQISQGERMEAILSVPQPTEPGSPGTLAAQFTVQFDPERWAFEGIEPLVSDISLENFGLNRTQKGLISFAYSTEGTARQGAFLLFKILLSAKKDQAANMPIQLSNWPTPSLAYLGDGSAWSPVLNWSNPPVASGIFPNPFGQTGTWVNAQQTGELKIWDSNGKTIFSQEVTTGNVFHLESSLFPGAGVFFWKMGELSGKLIYAP